MLPSTAVLAASAALQASKSAGRSQYNHMETEELLKHVEAVMPIGGDAWQNVANLYNAVAVGHPQMLEREKLSLKQRFARLCETKKPTGSGTMHPHVKKAKEINGAIHAMIDAGEVEENPGLIDW